MPSDSAPGSYTGFQIAYRASFVNKPAVNKPAVNKPAVNELARICAEYQARAESIPEDRYAWHRPEIQYWRTRTSSACLHLLREANALPLISQRVLDVGCGTGQWLLEFQQWGAQASNLHGIDLLEQRVMQARQRAPAADIQCGDASRLAWPDRSFDLVTQFTVFSSILDENMRTRIAAEMLRVVRPAGHILWYDCRYSNPSRAAVRGVSLREVERLFPDCTIRAERATLFPPLSRFVARHSWVAAALLESLPFTRTHLAALITPPR
jgi:ubiquinone/menaquinone biosynthesis C-methylase UbiE